MKKIKGLEKDFSVIEKGYEYKKMLERYNFFIKNNFATRLSQVYKNYSYWKEKAMEECKRLFVNYNGVKSGITGFNCMQFTYSFTFIFNGFIHFAFITKDYNRVINTNVLAR